MTYPPQQPGPFGQGPYGQQPPDPYGHQTSYQGLGGFPGSAPGGYPGGPSGAPPKKSNTKMIIAVVVVAVLVLGGAGTAIILLTKDDDKGSAATGSTSTTSGTPKSTGTRSSDDTEPSDSETPSTPRTESNGDEGRDPAAVQQAYIRAYESKDFDSVVASACDAYKEKFGTDTKKLEDQLEPFDIKATADGEPEVAGGSAFAKIDLELTQGSETKGAKIKIKIVKEDGTWKFCGEDEA